MPSFSPLFFFFLFYSKDIAADRAKERRTNRQGEGGDTHTKSTVDDSRGATEALSEQEAPVYLCGALVTIVRRGGGENKNDKKHDTATGPRQD